MIRGAGFWGLGFRAGGSGKQVWLWLRVSGFLRCKARERVHSDWPGHAWLSTSYSRLQLLLSGTRYAAERHGF